MCLTVECGVRHAPLPRPRTARAVRLRPAPIIDAVTEVDLQEPRRAPARAAGALRRAAPALLAYAGVRALGLLLLAVWSAAKGKSPHTLLTARWDSLWYTRVADFGYGWEVRLPNGDVHSNLAFFPLLPWLERLLSAMMPAVVRGRGPAGQLARLALPRPGGSSLVGRAAVRAAGRGLRGRAVGGAAGRDRAVDGVQRVPVHGARRLVAVRGPDRPVGDGGPARLARRADPAGGGRGGRGAVGRRRSPSCADGARDPDGSSVAHAPSACCSPRWAPPRTSCGSATARARARSGISTSRAGGATASTAARLRPLRRRQVHVIPVGAGRLGADRRGRAGDLAVRACAYGRASRWRSWCTRGSSPRSPCARRATSARNRACCCPPSPCCCRSRVALARLRTCRSALVLGGVAVASAVYGAFWLNGSGPP